MILEMKVSFSGKFDNRGRDCILLVKDVDYVEKRSRPFAGVRILNKQQLEHPAEESGIIKT